MSSTRKAKDDSVFHQGRYASSPEFERGLIANLVAKRCALLDAKADRELIWFIQFLSHQEGGLAAFAKDLIAIHADNLQTPVMAEIGMKPGKICNADQVRKIRKSLPKDEARWFLLKGETDGYKCGIISFEDFAKTEEVEDWRHRDSMGHPVSYPASEFLELFHRSARENLENELREICLDPSNKLENNPWYFPGLVRALRDYKAQFITDKSAGIVTTALGAKVGDVLDYTAYSRGLTLMEGEARLGKSYAARVWCEQHPGQARFVEVPPSNDEGNFFRALARGLGLGNFLQYKVTQIRERVESVLLTGDLLLVLDEAHRLWPQRNLRYGFPSRINWLMAMANHNIPICCIATPQFIECQKAAEQKGQWNSAQLTGRIGHYESLPAGLSKEDLMAVAKSILPEVNAKVLLALAIYARSSARYLAAIDSISKRARYIAMRDGRDAATTADVRKAMQESVIPADTKLQRALAAGRKGKTGSMTPAPALPDSLPSPQAESENFPPARSQAGQVIIAPGNRAPTASLVEA
jgi:hypothetical protein